MRKTVLLASVLLLFGGAVRAQVSLEDCRAMAREHYPAVRQYALIEKTRDFTLSNASKAWLPQIALGAQASWQNAVATFPEQFTSIVAAYGADFPGIRKDQYQLSMQIDQTVFDGGLTKARKEVAKAEAREQAASLDASMYELEKRIDDLYFGVLMLDNRIEQTASVITLLESNLETARSMVKGGVAMASDADAIEAELLGARQSQEQLRCAKISYLKAMELFTGRPLKGATLKLPLTPSARNAPRPEVQAIDAGIGVLDAQEALINASTLPRISLYAQGWYGYPGLDMFKSMTSSDWSWNAIVGVRMAWNISAFYTKSNDLRKIKTAKAVSEVQKDVFSFNTRLQGINTDGEISRLQRIASDDERIAQLRHNVRVAAESKFKNGVINSSELLKAITDESNALSAMTAHELELLKTQYESTHNKL